MESRFREGRLRPRMIAAETAGSGDPTGRPGTTVYGLGPITEASGHIGCQAREILRSREILDQVSVRLFEQPIDQG